MGAGTGVELGDADGDEVVTLAAGEMPGHDHPYYGGATVNYRATYGGGYALYPPDARLTGYEGSDDPHENCQPSFVGRWMIYAGCVATTGGGDEGPRVGEIREFAHDATATGWLVCGGTAARADYPWLHALYEADGYPWGNGNGTTTFGLPDSLGRVAVGDGTGTGLTARAVGDVFGEEAHELTTAELPEHRHTYAMGPAASATIDGGDSPLGTDLSHAVEGAQTGSAGSGTAHENMGPSLAVEYRVFAGTAAYPDAAELVTVPATMTESLTATVVLRASPGTAWTLTIDGETFATGTGTGTDQTVLEEPTAAMIGSSRAVLLTAGDATDTASTDVLPHVYLHTVPATMIVGVETTIVVLVSDGSSWTLTVDGEEWGSGTGTGAAQNATATPTSAMVGASVAVVLAVGAVEDTGTTACGNQATITLLGNATASSDTDDDTRTRAYSVHDGTNRGTLAFLIVAHTGYTGDRFSYAQCEGTSITRVGWGAISTTRDIHAFWVPDSVMGAAGSKTFVADFSVECQHDQWFFVELAGVAQTAPTLAKVEQQSDSPTGATVTAILNSWIVSMIGTAYQLGTHAPQSGQTELNDANNSDGTIGTSGATGYEAITTAGDYEALWSTDATAAAFAVAVAPALTF